MNIPDDVSEVYITDELFRRPAHQTDPSREKLAVKNIAQQMAGDPGQVLPVLVDLALELCHSVAGGISIYEQSEEVFRWHHLRGTLENFTGATTPRKYSPCGITLDQAAPVLVQNPERVYSWLVDAGVSIPECLLVPLFAGSANPLGTLWVVSSRVGHFHAGHVSTMQELAEFAGFAWEVLLKEKRLRTALEQQEILAREMGHRVKNLFAITDGMIRLSANRSSSKEQMAKALSGRLHALADANALIRRTFSPTGNLVNASNLLEIITAVMRPYPHATTTIRGPAVQVGEHATNTIALVFHEMATNAAKYGALSTEAGAVTVEWSIGDERLEFDWRETGGPKIMSEPAPSGFGTSLVANTILRQGGTIATTWHLEGMQVQIGLPLRSLAH